MKTPIVLYRGPSQLDGAPIVVLATIGSSNVKTGPMVQTWILRADMLPTVASKATLDGSVCGDCPRRHSTGGDCYVTLFQAPRAVWDHWDRNGRPWANYNTREVLPVLAKAAQANGLRMGSYGDPMAVPYYVWRDVIAATRPKLTTGYTHQWRRQWAPDVRAWYSANVMASCDSPSDAETARTWGWRYFLAVTPENLDNIPERTILCLAEREGNKARTCETCGICNGTRGKDVPAVSVYLVEHGARSQGKHKRIAALKVIQ